MPVSEQSALAALLRETRQRLELSQVKFVEKLGVPSQSVNRRENGCAQPLPIRLEQREMLLHPLGVQGEDLLIRYFRKPQR